MALSGRSVGDYMKKQLLLFLALSVVLVSACTGTGSVVDEDQNVDVGINDAQDDPLQTTNNEEIESEILEDDDTAMEDDTTGSPDEDTTTTRTTTEEVEFVRLLDASLDKSVVSWQDELVLSFGIYNNGSTQDYNVIIQIFDEDEEKVYDQQEEGIHILRNKTKWMDVPIDITSTFKRGETYTVHAGLFDEDWNLVEWDWTVGNFSVV